MAKRKGTVSKIGKSKYSYFIQLDGDGHYFNTKYDPKCGVGDVVGVEFEPKGEQRSQIKKVVTLDDKGGPKGYQDSGGGYGGGGGGGSYKNDNRQESIIFQSSRKDALVLVGLLLEHETVKVPKGDPGRVVIEELVDEVTARFIKDASNPSEAFKNAKAAEKDADDDWDDSDDSSPSNSGDWDDDDDWS